MLVNRRVILLMEYGFVQEIVIILATQIFCLGVLSVVLVVAAASDYILLSQRRLLRAHELPFCIHQMTRVVMTQCFCSCPNPVGIRSFMVVLR